MIYGALALVFLAVMLALVSPLLFAAIAADIIRGRKEKEQWTKKQKQCWHCTQA